MAPRQQIVSMNKTGSKEDGDFRPRRMGDPVVTQVPDSTAPGKPRRMGDPVEVDEAPKGLSAQGSVESLPVVPPKRMGDEVVPSPPSDTLLSSTSPGSGTKLPIPPQAPASPPPPLVPVSPASAEKEVLTPEKIGSQPSSLNPSTGNPTPPV